MKIKCLELRNFRGIRELRIDQLDPHMNVIVGVNGSGKSSVLDCAAILLSRLIWRIRSTTGTGRLLRDLDITNERPSTTNSIAVNLDNKNIHWELTKTRTGRKPNSITNLEELKNVAAEIQTRLAKDPKSSLPLAVYYPVHRAVLDIPLRIRTRHTFEQLSAYDLALTGGRSDFRLFFEWFRNREDIENEQRARASRSYSDTQLSAVREAIETFLPGVSQFRVQRSPLRMVLSKGGHTLVVDQLSDGEKCLMAMVGDLARRLSIANPGIEEPHQGQAVVLIDELDLHLHPSWQRQVVPNLVRTFPNCQFVVTTHSAQILSHVKPDNVLILDSSAEGVALHRPSDSYGLDSNRILEDIMGVSERPLEIKKEIQKLFEKIDDGDLKPAESLLAKLQIKIGSDPELVKAGALIRRKEILKK